MIKKQVGSLCMANNLVASSINHASIYAQVCYFNKQKQTFKYSLNKTQPKIQNKEDKVQRKHLNSQKQRAWEQIFVPVQDEQTARFSQMLSSVYLEEK